ncbi:tetratricopeptide repeat protein [Luteolibacter arcticus]|uniref:Tetratricopeptide repeat protein n=1 Tax=Luteolibacter arcticus TaxID=1581411 RepID=A0ABT3GQS1_9BACT|nr:serine/threonine-protein kinase [Luteolibacter arcticus]MCW1925873.1 tetratricopeptide repeat protein [Luteolibacter arcticus]
MNFSPDEVIELFNQALERTPAERAACLDQACSGDSGMRHRMEELLRAHDSAGAFLQTPVSLLHAAEPIGEGPGKRVGRYKLIQQIGEGGCGVVFLAEQEQPVRREVALKIVKPGMDTRSVIARFESERQALAMMEHPHIAQVFDAGATEAGRPYFVMELVRGERITDYCNHRKMTLKERLKLFVQVCHAVQHAHQKGIIHRDLKPSNILVSTTQEGEPLPKVIDFGIAKATAGQQLTDRTFFTAFEMLVGTPAYMSPEQADLKNLDVDTRTDIYSLGVLLYELLTGTMPFEVREIQKAGLDEVRRDILDKLPVRPSIRLKSLTAGGLGTSSQQRHVEAPRLPRLIRGDLDWIVMKTLEKDRSRRYPTANALALDVQRHLANEPVTARPPSRLYQVGKLVARNRLLVGSLAVIALLLVTSLATVSLSLARERTAREQAESERTKAKEEEKKTSRANEVLGEMLSSVAPSMALGRDTTILRELLDRTDGEISKNLKDQPEVEAKLRMLLGNSYFEIRDIGSAERMLRRALEIYEASDRPKRLETASAKSALGYISLSNGDLEEAEAYFKSADELWREFGPKGKEGEIRTMEYLAIMRSRQGRNEEAESLMRRVYESRRTRNSPEDLELINTLTSLGLVLHGAGKYAEAESSYREALQMMHRKHGAEHPIQLGTMMNLAKVTSAQGKADEEKGFLREAVALYRKRFHPDHPGRLEATLKLAEVHRKAGDLASAEPLYREVIENGSGKDDARPTSANASLSLVQALLAKKMTGEAKTVLDQALTAEFMATPACIPLLETRASLLARAGRWKEAVADAAKLVEMQPDNHERYHKLAPLLVAAGDHEAYRHLCPEIVVRFAATTNARIADRMAKDCLILPGAVEDLAPVGRMADLALKGGGNDVALPFFQVCKALADLRQGNFAAAADLAGKAVPSSFKEAEVEALAVGAMALQRMNQPEEAKRLLAQGTTTFETKLSKLESGELRGNWEDWVIARALLEEARALIDGGSPK